MSNIVLSAQSSSNEIKGYFNSVLTLTKSGEKFPVDLDDVWPLCYVQKVKAVQIMTDSGQFYEGEDYILLSQKVKQTENVSDGVFSQKVKNPIKNVGVFSQKVKKPLNGRPTNKYMLSVPCMEYLIARKVRAVFEVYRRVFHEFLNMKQMSKSEMRLQVFMDMQSEISRQSNVIKKQGKRITALLSQLESEKHAKRERLLLVSQTRKDDFASWLESESFSGTVSMKEIHRRYSDYCHSIGAQCPNSSVLGKVMVSLGQERVRRAEGFYYIFGSEPCHEN